MPERKMNGGDYRYGFNGKENDNEIKGEGNSIDFGARMYDSRLVRWNKPDNYASMYPFSTPYSFALNKPTLFIDPDGNIVDLNLASKKAKARIKYLIENSARFRYIYEKLDGSSFTFKFTHEDRPNSSGFYNLSDNTINIDLDAGDNTYAEEFFHAYQSWYSGTHSLIAVKVATEKSLPQLKYELLPEIHGGIMGKKSYVESEAKVFKYLVSLEIGDNWDAPDLLNGGGVGKKYATINKRTLSESGNIITNPFSSIKIDNILQQKISTDFYKWAESNNIDSYTEGGIIKKPMDALNSTSKPLKELDLSEPLILGSEH